MKKIKFRAWDKINKCYGGECYLQVMGDGTLSYASALIVEQYTGLNNPDGIEIYEGDLLDDGDFGLMEVFWSESDGCAYVRHIGENGHLSGDDLCCYTDRPVVGNIHQ